MNCLSQVRSFSAAIFRRESHIICRSALRRCYAPFWKRNIEPVGVKTIDLEIWLTRFRAQCYSSRSSPSGKTARSRKLKLESSMELEKDAFYVVRKGDVVGVYKSLADCQAQVGPSICNPPVSVYKGYSIPKDAEDYLVSHGFHNALYTIRAADLKDDIFGTLVPCPFQDPASSEVGTLTTEDASERRSLDMLKSENVAEPGSRSISTEPSRDGAKLDDCDVAEGASSGGSCNIEFDGASKGNPGAAGAAAVLRADDGTLICKVRQGLGKATNNAAEYKAMILGLKYALEKGYTSIRVKGDSKLVCMQMKGLWQVKNEGLSELHKEAKTYEDKFSSFQISHVLREFNSEADSQANLAVHLADGQVQEELE